MENWSTKYLSQLKDYINSKTIYIDIDIDIYIDIDIDIDIDTDTDTDLDIDIFISTDDINQTPPLSENYI